MIRKHIVFMVLFRELALGGEHVMLPSIFRVPVGLGMSGMDL